MAAVTICSDFGAQKNKVWHCFHCFPIYFPWTDECWALSQLFLSPLSLSSRGFLVPLHSIKNRVLVPPQGLPQWLRHKESTCNSEVEGGEDPVEKEMATHSCILAWEMPWTVEPSGLQSMGSQRVRHDLVAKQQQSSPSRDIHNLTDTLELLPSSDGGWWLHLTISTCRS